MSEPYSPDDLARRLNQRMEELMVEIIEIKVYLAEPLTAEGLAMLPLGIMGEVMSSELEHETSGLIEQAHYITREKDVSSWDKLKTSVYLHKKIAMLVTLTRIISQLPANSAQARLSVFALTERIAEQCQKIDTVLKALVSESIEPRLVKV
ncbi:MAG: hypothetical protein ACK502_09220 [Alphaproteobacteria bacterium]|jgi:hypothetical protein